MVKSNFKDLRLQSDIYMAVVLNFNAFNRTLPCGCALVLTWISLISVEHILMKEHFGVSPDSITPFLFYYHFKICQETIFS